MSLEPEMFLGSVPCAPGITGALHYYVADIDDVDAETDAGVSTLRVTTPVVPCARVVRLDVRAGRRYAATIRGYDERIEEDGSVEPSWTASCGRGSEDLDAGTDPLAPTVATAGISTSLRGCTTFRRTGANRGAVVVDTSEALGSWTCGSSIGEVVSVRAELGSASVEVPCGCAALLPDVAPGHHEVLVEALGNSAGDAGSSLERSEECLTVEEALARSGRTPEGPSGPDAGTDGMAGIGAMGDMVDAAVPPPGDEPSLLDAGVVDASVADASTPPPSDPIDASLPGEASDAGEGSGPPETESSRSVVATTTCLARVIAGAVTEAACRSFPPAP